MSLTEREKEIAVAIFNNFPSYIEGEEDFVAITDLFLSRIREEQEAVAWMQEEPINKTFYRVHPTMSDGPLAVWNIPLFTIPPASSEPNKWDKALELNEAWKRGYQEARATQPTCDCNELVDALNAVQNDGDWRDDEWVPTVRALDKVEQALTNHTKRMKGVK